MAKSELTLERICQILKADLRRLHRKRYTPEQIKKCLEKFKVREDKYHSALENLRFHLERQATVCELIHSISIRVKPEESLVRKLAAKCLDRNTPRKITADRLFHPKKGVTDLGALRIIHLYKADWPAIHRYIIAGCGGQTECIERIAYIRIGEDKKPYKRDSRGKLFEPSEIEEHPQNYSSLHYVLRYKRVQYVSDLYIECQVRTIFEEGWGEIDHQHRYPFGANRIVTAQLDVLNRSTDISNKIAAFFGELKQFPLFIHWDEEQRLEQAADKVFCLSPDLQWAVRHKRELIRNIKESHVEYHYFYIRDGRKERSAERKKRVLEKAAARAHCKRKLKITATPAIASGFPILSDVLLLKRTSLPRAKRERNLVIMSAPPRETVARHEQLDMLVTDERAIRNISRFFDRLGSAGLAR